MVVRCGVATAAFVGLLTAPSLAAAQAFEFNPTVTTEAGFAANALFPAKTAATSRADPFVTLAPALGMTFETPRTINDLQAAVAGTLPIPIISSFKEIPPSLTGSFTYTSHFALSELWNLDIGGALSAIPVNAFVNAVSATSSTIDATSSTFSYNFSANGQETLTRELSPSARLTQVGNVVYNVPYDPSATTQTRATTLTAKGSLAFTQNFALDALTGTLTAGYTRFGDVPATKTAARTELLNSLVATWQRSFTASLTGSVDLGVLQALSLDSDTSQLWQPTGGARLAYDFNVATASLGYTHGATVNVFTATLNLTDEAVLRAAIPFGETGLALATSVGYTRTTPLFVDVKITSPADIYLADLAFTFSPPAFPKLLASVRGSVNRQVPTYAGDVTGPFTRLTLSASVGFAFPDSKAAAVSQARMSPAYVPTPTLSSDSTPAPGVQPKPIELDDALTPETTLPPAPTIGPP